jgi:hypothetical protein
VFTPDALLASLASVPPGGTLVLSGRRVNAPGVVAITFADGNPCAPRITEGGRRTVPLQAIVAHTTNGTPHDPPLSPTAAQSSSACRLARYQTTTDRDVSWDFTVSTTGVVLQQNDPTNFYSWQAGLVNGRTCGIENEQGPGGTLYPAQVQAFVRLVDTITRHYGIQRQLPARRDAAGKLRPLRGVIARLDEHDGACRTWWGVLGHRNITPNRGPGDPGDVLMQALLDAGYEGFDLDAEEDLRAWALRQRGLGVQASGVPGPETVAALKRRGFSEGLWVRRPGDRW